MDFLCCQGNNLTDLSTRGRGADTNQWRETGWVGVRQEAHHVRGGILEIDKSNQICKAEGEGDQGKQTQRQTGVKEKRKSREVERDTNADRQGS